MNADDLKSTRPAKWRWRWRPCWGLALAGVLAACSSAPPLRLHSLQPMSGDATGETAGMASTARQPLWIKLAPIGIPPAVDRPEWLVDQPDGTLRLLEQDRWAGPLRNEVQAALLDGLRQRYGALQPQRPDAPGGAPVWRVVVDIERLETSPGVEARLDAAWSISASGDPHGGAANNGVSCRTSLRQAAGVDTASLAASHRRNVQALADALGRALTDAAAGRVAHCDADTPPA